MKELSELFQRARAAAGRDLTFRELAEAIWLIAYAPVAGSVAERSAAHDSSTNAPIASARDLPSDDEDELERSEEEPVQPRARSRFGSHAHDGGDDLRASETRRLDAPLELRPSEPALRVARALHALAPRRPIGRLEVDVESTVAQSARTGGDLLPVFRARSTKSEHLILLIDRSGQLAPWHDDLRQWITALDRFGSFASHVVIELDLSERAVVRAVRLGRDRQPREALIGLGPELRPGLETLILIVTDGLAPAFTSGALGLWLGNLPRTSRLAWLHPWEAHRRFRSGLRVLDRCPPETCRAVPVSDLSTRGLFALSPFVHGRGTRSLTTIRLPAQAPFAGRTRTSSASPVDWLDRANRFAMAAEWPSVQLLALASAVPGRVDLELLRALAGQFGGLVGEIERFHLAEALTSGLLERVSAPGFGTGLVARFKSAEARDAIGTYLDRGRTSKVFEFLLEHFLTGKGSSPARARALAIPIEVIAAVMRGDAAPPLAGPEGQTPAEREGFEVLLPALERLNPAVRQDLPWLQGLYEPGADLARGAGRKRARSRKLRRWSTAKQLVHRLLALASRFRQRIEEYLRTTESTKNRLDRTLAARLAARLVLSTLFVRILQEHQLIDSSPFGPTRCETIRTVLDLENVVEDFVRLPSVRSLLDDQPIFDALRHSSRLRDDIFPQADRSESRFALVPHPLGDPAVRELMEVWAAGPAVGGLPDLLVEDTIAAELIDRLAKPGRESGSFALPGELVRGVVAHVLPGAIRDHGRRLRVLDQAADASCWLEEALTTLVGASGANFSPTGAVQQALESLRGWAHSYPGLLWTRLRLLLHVSRLCGEPLRASQDMHLVVKLLERPATGGPLGSRSSTVEARNTFAREECHLVFSTGRLRGGLSASAVELAFQAGQPNAVVALLLPASFTRFTRGAGIVEELSRRDLEAIVDLGTPDASAGFGTLLILARKRPPSADTVILVERIPTRRSRTEEATTADLLRAARGEHGGAPTMLVRRIPLATLSHAPWSLSSPEAGALLRHLEAQGSVHERVAPTIRPGAYSLLSHISNTRGFLRRLGVREVTPCVTGSASIRPWRKIGYEVAPANPADPHWSAFSALLGKTGPRGGPARTQVTPSIIGALVGQSPRFFFSRKPMAASGSTVQIDCGPDAVPELLTLVALLQSSTLAFWFRQHSTAPLLNLRVRSIANAPCPVARDDRLVALARELVRIAHELERAEDRVRAAAQEDDPRMLRLLCGQREPPDVIGRAVALQHEIDWRVYELFGLTPPVEPALHPKEIPAWPLEQSDLLQLRSAMTQGADPGRVTWPGDYRNILERRMRAIPESPQLNSIEVRPNRASFHSWYRPSPEILQEVLLDRCERILEESQRPLSAGMIYRDIVRTGLASKGREDLEGLLRRWAAPADETLAYTASGMQKRKLWEEEGAFPESKGQARKQRLRFTPSDYRTRELWRLRGPFDIPQEAFLIHEEPGRDARFSWAAERLRRRYSILSDS